MEWGFSCAYERKGLRERKIWRALGILKISSSVDFGASSSSSWVGTKKKTVGAAASSAGIKLN